MLSLSEVGREGRERAFTPRTEGWWGLRPRGLPPPPPRLQRPHPAAAAAAARYISFLQKVTYPPLPCYAARRLDRSPLVSWDCKRERASSSAIIDSLALAKISSIPGAGGEMGFFFSPPRILGTKLNFLIGEWRSSRW